MKLIILQMTLPNNITSAIEIFEYVKIHIVIPVLQLLGSLKMFVIVAFNERSF